MSIFKTIKNAKINIVTSSTNSNPTIILDGKTVSVSKNGVTSFELSPGSHSITKGTTNTYLFLISVSEEGTNSDTPTESGSENTTESDFQFNGDVDQNTVVDINDAVKVINYVLDKTKNPLSEEELKAAKINKNDDEITAKNAAYILDYVLKNSAK